MAGFLKDPSGDAYWGKTKLAKTDDAMKAVDLAPAELDDLVEALYAQSGATDVDAAKRDRGKTVFEKACTELVFCRQQRPADGRLREVQGRGRLRSAARTGDRQDDVQITDVEPRAAIRRSLR